MANPRFLTLLLIWLFITTKPIVATASNTDSNSLTVTTWNFNWLSDDRPKGKHSNIPIRASSDYLALANIISGISPDVLAFQEVANPQSIAKLISLEQYQLEFSSRKAKSNREIWPQFVGFAIREGLNYQRHPDLHQLDIWDNQYLRYGVDISLYQDGKPALRLLAVHLKSGCYSNRHRNRHCTTLRKQIDVLAKWVSQRQAEQQPYIILGDFNRRLAQKEDKYWQELTSEVLPVPVLITEGLKSQCRSQAYNKRKQQWEVRQYPEFIDHFILDARIQEKDTQVSFYEHLYSDQQLKQIQLSDHCPLSISLQL